MIVLIALFFLFSSIFSFCLFRNLLNPPFLLSVTWFFIFSFYSLAPFYDGEPNYYYLLFPVGHVLFMIGFIIITLRTKTTKIVYKENKRPKVNYRMFNILIVAQFVIFLLTLTRAITAIKSNFISNWWFTLKWMSNEEMYSNGWIFDYTRILSFVLTYVLAALLFSYKEKRIKRLFLVQFVLAIMFALLSLGRTFLFQLIIPIVFLYLFINIKDSKLAMRVLIKFLLLSLVIFFSINSLKYVSSSSSSIMDSFYLYFTGSIKGFVEWATTFNNFEYGKNTFRFFLAVFNQLGYSVQSEPIQEGFIDIGNGFTTNVYSIYKWYFSDFGSIYALLIQLILGITYGILYINLFNKKGITRVIFLSIAYYPLFMQFFQDQYLSLTSTWIQISFWLYLILHSGIFIKKEKANDKLRHSNSKLERRISN